MRYDENIACHTIALEVAKKLAVGSDTESLTKDMSEKYKIAFNIASEQLKQPIQKARIGSTKRFT